MSPDNTHKLMGIYTVGLILGVNPSYMYSLCGKQLKEAETMY